MSIHQLASLPACRLAYYLITIEESRYKVEPSCLRTDCSILQLQGITSMGAGVNFTSYLYIHPVRATDYGALDVFECLQAPKRQESLDMA